VIKSGFDGALVQIRASPQLSSYDGKTVIGAAGKLHSDGLTLFQCHIFVPF
jgi:hypothetical protein